MTVSVVWSGINAVQTALTEKVGAMNAATERAIATGAHAVEAAMKVRAGEGGRHAKGTPTPATIGSGPAVITGYLRRSIIVGPVTPEGPFGFAVKVGPTAVQSRRLELEYDYPYAGPGFADAAPTLPALYAAEWAKAW